MTVPGHADDRSTVRTGGRLLVTDIDGTFLGDDAASRRLWALAGRHGIAVVFATGRRIEGVEEVQAALALTPVAPAAICQVGTEIWLWDGAAYRLDRRWSALIANGWRADEVSAVVDRLPGFQRQDQRWQTALKRSWYAALPSPEAREVVEAALADRGLTGLVVASGDHWLDVLPAGAGKGAAAAHLADRFGVDAARVVTAGDSGNDLDMMRPELGFHSVAVANAHPELATHRAPRLRHAGRSHAGGIIEALEGLGWLPPGAGAGGSG